MTAIATLGPEGSHAWQAAKQFDGAAEIQVFPHLSMVVEAFHNRKADYAVVPVYNTREGEIKECFQMMENLTTGHWVENIVLPVHLSLGVPPGNAGINTIIGTTHVLRQCDSYISKHFANATLIAVQDPIVALDDFKDRDDFAIIEAENLITAQGLSIHEREVAPHNRTRFAVLGKTLTDSTGYDATVLLTTPLKDRVGLLFDILGEFTRRGVNLLDMRTETDIKSQKLQFYFEAEGHINDQAVKEAVEHIENNVVQERKSVKILGSFPRVDMRVKRIKKTGFIGSGDMSAWFARRLENEGYQTVLTGRNSLVRPEEMITDADVVFICVPISATPETIEQYAPKLRDGQALILLAGEAENNIDTALRHTSKGVEVMLIHNLWGPKATTMKDKNASVVRTSRSGALCSEIEAFLFKHGAVICRDKAVDHDLLMGVGQKLPTAISLALAMTLKENKLSTEDIDSHSTLTSLYSILAMARVHSQNPRTYAEIMTAKGAGGKIVSDFINNLSVVLDHARSGDVDGICSLIETGALYLGKDFLKARMRQALAMDEVLGYKG